MTRIRAAARRSIGLGIATGVLLLSAPFVSTTRHEEVLPPPANPPEPAAARLPVKVRQGDTLLAVLKRYGIGVPSAHALIAKVRPFVNPRKIQPGDNLHVVVSPGDRTVEALELVVDDNLVRVKATSEGWSVERQEIPFVRETKVVRGTIKGSLYESGTEAGLSPQQIVDLAKIFESDIDFFSDFQPQDAFSILMEELRYADGRRVAGRILAAELEANNEFFDAFYFTGANGSSEYYNNKGEALRRAFLRAPLSFVRISSPYSKNRRHPIFRTVRPHLAIDYAAPAGSPVVAIGSGRVEFAGWRGGYGNVVDIRHTGGYVSRYAHFSKLAPGLRRGRTVQAGEVIGYVGQTGHATGPHLHFEFLRGGAKINFLDMRIPKSQQLAKEDLPAFHRLRDEREAMLRGEPAQRVVHNPPKDL
ncbi:MAG TPA: peptidoglycan DD-metalloendopeptidase family protein [Candidatus Binatia bacterium]|nr:peptidoglycan DD-metalloendopeptidase family protein [Candidatus Binatia bacterium]